MNQDLLTKAQTLPLGPGCYLMKNKDGKVIYVGKAKILKARVTSYFNNSIKSPKTEILVSHIKDFDFIITGSDTEAFVLENNLIKKHTPKYNIRLRDDKTYPYIMVNLDEAFPRLEYVRRPDRKKNRIIFGPFVVGSNIFDVLKVVVKSFGLRDCSLHEFLKRKEPCLLYQMKQCSAPCVNLVTTEEYKKDLELAMNFFKGKEKSDYSLKILIEKMMSAANNEDFECAAMLRDQIQLLQKFIEDAHQKNAELHGQDSNIDVIAFHVGDIEVDISLYMIRNGILLGHKTFHFACADLIEDVDKEVLTYMFQYYTSTFEVLPDLIIAPFILADEEQLELALMKTINKKIKVEAPKRKYKSLYEITLTHAKESSRMRTTNQESIYVGLGKLQELLNLPERPMTLECFDVAIWQGKSPTASLIYFHEGKPDKKHYRYYHLQERPEGNNDFAMMQELFSRRLEHGEFPDVFVIDGGLGQVNAVTQILKEKNVFVPVVGIAKSKTDSDLQNTEINKSEERLVIPGRLNPYILAKTPALFRIIVQMRDEAHRFSRKLHHHAESVRLFGKKKTNSKRE